MRYAASGIAGVGRLFLEKAEYDSQVQVWGIGILSPWVKRFIRRLFPSNQVLIGKSLLIVVGPSAGRVEFKTNVRYTSVLCRDKED